MTEQVSPDTSWEEELDESTKYRPRSAELDARGRKVTSYEADELDAPPQGLCGPQLGSVADERRRQNRAHARGSGRTRAEAARRLPRKVGPLPRAPPQPQQPEAGPEHQQRRRLGDAGHRLVRNGDAAGRHLAVVAHLADV